MKATSASIRRLVDKTIMGHLHNGIVLGHKKEENSTLCNSMDGSVEHYAKSEKDRYHMISLTYGI